MYVYSKEFYERTITTDWNLVCDNIHFKSLYKTVLFIGSLFILLTGILGDKFGRKRTAYFLIILNCFATMLSAIAFNLVKDKNVAMIILSICRFLMGISDGLYLPLTILAIEIVGPSYRVIAASLMYYCYTCGEFVLLLCAFFLRDHKNLSICIAVLLSIGVFYFWYVPESVRYLVQRKKFKEVDFIFKRIAKSNKRKYISNFNENDSEKEELIEKKKSTPISLLFTKEILPRFLVNFINWFTNGLIYFGISINTDVLGGNPYLNFLYLGIVELFSLIICNSILSKFGRKKPYLINLWIVIFSFILIGFIPHHMNWLLIILVLIGKFSITFTFNTIMITSAESFPTVIRSRAISFCLLFGRFGSIISPTVSSLGMIYFKSLPYLIYASIAATSAIAYLIVMPETSGGDLPETLDDLVKKKSKSNDSELEESSLGKF